MRATPDDRRAHPRIAQNGEVELILAGRRVRARMHDLSRTGLQLTIDPDKIALLRGSACSIAVPGHPKLGLSVKWGLFDGRIGASFDDSQAASAMVESLMGAAMP